LSPDDAFLERLSRDLQERALALEHLIQQQETMVGQRHVTRHRHVAPTDQPRLRDGVVGGATRAGRDQPHAVAGEAGNAVDPRGLNGLSQAHIA
jgi:hypothetical protein